MKPPLRQGSPDDFQTPPQALNPLLPYLKKEWVIWECAAGKRNLSNGLIAKGYKVISTDLADIKPLEGETGWDFLKWKPNNFDCIITNPPFKYKQQFLERCYILGKPFALLLPLTTFETTKRQKLFKENGVEVIFFDKRINFETPNQVKNSSAWFATAWFTNGLNIGKQLSFKMLQSI